MCRAAEVWNADGSYEFAPGERARLKGAEWKKPLGRSRVSGLDVILCLSEGLYDRSSGHDPKSADLRSLGDLELLAGRKRKSSEGQGEGKRKRRERLRQGQRQRQRKGQRQGQGPEPHPVFGTLGDEIATRHELEPLVAFLIFHAAGIAYLFIFD